MSGVTTAGVRTLASGTPDAVRCPNCHGSSMAPFYEVASVPSHSCLLVETREEAAAYPRGTLRIALCRACGFIGNTRFDPALIAYSPEYEETQHFSPRFEAFARELVDHLVRDYGVRGRTVLEIGCGKGEFLSLLCAAGDNTGIGIDPGCIPERLGERGSRIRFIRDVYSEGYGDLAADVVACRHTLEHIDETRDFLTTVRRGIGDRRDTLVFFEVPDVLRVLREQAFWDIYHEHCSYFSAGSLARLFRSCGFEILELTRAFDDQYLLLFARPVAAPPTPTLAIEDDMDELTGAVDEFRRVCARQTEDWHGRVRRLRAEGHRPVVWGAGSKAVAFFATLGLRDEIDYCVDINPFKQGKFLPGTGTPIVGPSFLAEYRPRTVIIMNAVYHAEISRTLSTLGVDADVVSV